MDTTKLLSRIQFVMVFVIFGVVVVTFRGPWNVLRVVGLGIAAPALVFFAIAKAQLGDSFSVEPLAQKLIAHGIYAKVRHPMYLFSELFFFGLILYAGQLWFLLIFLGIVPLQLFRMRREDQVLEEKFGEDYRRYRQNAWF